MLHSLSNNMASPKSFNSSNSPFGYPAPAQTRGKIFLCYCSLQVLEPGKWNAWDLQKVAGQQLCWRKYPDPRQFSRGCFLSNSTPSNSLEPGTQMAPTNHLRLMICQYLQDHKEKCYFSDSTPKLNWERRGQQRKHFKFKKLTALSTFLFFLSIATNRSTWKDLCGVPISLTIFLWNLLIKHRYELVRKLLL